MKRWGDIKHEFETDGSLRDIYVEDIDPAVWNTFIGKLKQSKYKLAFSHGDVETELPGDLNAIKRMQQTSPTTLYIWLTDNIQINCHFFLEKEIELDVSPHDIKDESDYAELVCFLEWLASVTSGEVKIFHEGMQEQLILSVCK